MVQNIDKVVITPSNITIDVGDEPGFSATAWAGAIPKPLLSVTWVSSNTAVGTIDTNGKFKALTHGVTTITATVTENAVTKSCNTNVTVQQPGSQGGGGTVSGTGSQQEIGSEMKSTVALLAILLYILFAYFGTLGFGFSLSSIFILVTFIVTFLALDKLKSHKTALLILWVILFAIGGGLGFSTELYFLMLVTMFAAYMDDIKTAIIFLGTAALSMFTFNASVIGFIVLIVVFMFIYAASDNIPLGAVMMVPLLIVGWFIGAGWGDIVEQKVASINTEISVSTGISTGSIGDQLNSAFNNTWLLLTDPNAWYEKTYVLDGSERDEGLSSAALEVTKIEALPASVLPLDTFDVVFELENKGTKDAVGVTVGAKGDTFADACGRFSGLYCNPKCGAAATGGAPTIGTNQELASCVVKKTLNKIAPMEKGFDTFTFQAPECPGTYKVGAAVKYNYTVETTMNLQMISREYYTDLLRNNKMKWSDEISLTSAGPFKMSLRTSPTQPIPDKISPDVPQVFKVYLGLVNEKPGTATMQSAIIKLPNDIELVGWDSMNNKMDDSCSITYDVKLDEQGINGYLSDVVAKLVKENKPMSQADYEAMENRYYVAAFANATRTGSEYITYRTVDPTPERKFTQNEWRYYKCSFKRTATAPKIDQIQTFFMRAELPYSFEYEKYASVSVRSVTGAIPPQCRKELKPVYSISTAQTKPQTKDAILKAVADEIYYCYSKNDGYIYDSSAKCGTFKINLEACGVNSITADDIKTMLNSIPKYQVVVSDLFQNLLVREMDGTVVDIKTAGGQVVFNDTQIYTINMEYVAKYYTPSFLGMLPGIGSALATFDALMTKNTLVMTKQSAVADTLCAAAPAAPSTSSTSTDTGGVSTPTDTGGTTTSSGSCTYTAGTSTTAGVCTDDTGTYNDACFESAIVFHYCSSDNKCTQAPAYCNSCSAGVCETPLCAKTPIVNGACATGSSACSDNGCTDTATEKCCKYTTSTGTGGTSPVVTNPGTCTVTRQTPTTPTSCTDSTGTTLQQTQCYPTGNGVELIYHYCSSSNECTLTTAKCDTCAGGICTPKCEATTPFLVNQCPLDKESCTGCSIINPNDVCCKLKL